MLRLRFLYSYLSYRVEQRFRSISDEEFNSGRLPVILPAEKAAI